MAKTTNNDDIVVCPVGSFLRDIEKTYGKKSKFAEHMTQSRIEVLKGIRSLVDDRIEDLDRKKSAGRKKKPTKIKVD